jgi:SAM-dependent methyltransferase
VSEYEKGLYATLKIPAVYDAVQWLVGSHRARQAFITDCLKPRAGQTILDIGCGTAEINEILPQVDYWGFDPNPAYIRKAQIRFPNAHFVCADRLEDSGLSQGSYDAIMAVFVFHHLDDDIASSVFEQSLPLLKPGGTFCTIEPCYTPDQHPFARWLINRDRGQNARTRSGYIDLAAPYFPDITTTIHHDLLRVPYTWCMLRATK